jgi:hypothetical protein
VYARAAPDARVDLAGFLVASAKSRGARILVAGLALGGFGVLASRWRRWYPTYLVLFAITFAAGLTGVIRYWS